MTKEELLKRKEKLVKELENTEIALQDTIKEESTPIKYKLRSSLFPIGIILITSWCAIYNFSHSDVVLGCLDVVMWVLMVIELLFIWLGDNYIEWYIKTLTRNKKILESQIEDINNKL